MRFGSVQLINVPDESDPVLHRQRAPTIPQFSRANHTAIGIPTLWSDSC